MPPGRNPLCLSQAINCVCHLVPNFLAVTITLGFQRRRSISCQRGRTAPVESLEMSRVHLNGFFLSWNPHRYLYLSLTPSHGLRGTEKALTFGCDPMSGTRLSRPLRGVADHRHGFGRHKEKPRTRRG
jgi:hypothetical protein